MKFQHLPLGARFEFDSKVYVKSGPLTATAEDGSGQRLIPRHVLLKAVSAPVGDHPSMPESEVDRLRAAATRFVRECTLLIETACTHADPSLVNELMSALDVARERFEAELSKR